MKGRKDVSKTVKHCEVCQEDFGDRFSFCPVCGESLKTIGDAQPETVAHNHEIAQPEMRAAATAPLNVERANVERTREVVAAAAPRVERVQESNAETVVRPLPANDGLYHLTILQAPKSYGRVFTLGAVFGLFVLMTGMIGVYVYDIFNYNLDIAAVENEIELTNAFLSDEPPAVAEPEPPKPKNSDKGGGGGGGGGNQDPKPASKGVDAAQMRAEPVIRPSVNNYQNDRFELKQQSSTVGDQPKKEPGVLGIKNATSTDPSDGSGFGRGQGSGFGGGQGGGNGTGKGNGNGSGSGNGDGNGNGNGRGDGDNGPPPPAPVKREPVAVVSEKLKIINKPSPGYTDDARKNNISGTVRLRVTFSASGQVTGVSVISGLPNGLTEKAIAAAKQISFTPEKRNGQAISISRPVEFSFKIY